MIHEVFKVRRHRLRESNQPAVSDLRRVLHERRVQDGPLPYRQDRIPPSYIDLCLDEADLPSYDQAQAMTLKIEDVEDIDDFECVR